MGIKCDIEDAIQVHGAWKSKFRDFLNGKTGMDMSEVCETDSCKLGRWLEDGGHRMLSPEDHAKTCELHAQFHQVAGDIVSNIKQKNFMAAREALAPAGAFDQASHSLCAFLRKASLHGGPKSEKKTDEAKAADNPDVKAAKSPQQQD